MHDYSFDIDLCCSVTVKAASHEEALLRLRANLDCASSNLGVWDHMGEPILAEVSLRGTPHLYASDDPAIPDPENTRPPIVFEPWTAELVEAVNCAIDMLEGEEDSVMEEHRHLWVALRSLVNTIRNGGADRESVLLAHLTHALYKDIADPDTTFMDWLLGEVMALPDGEAVKEWAAEYLALTQARHTQLDQIMCRFCIPSTGYVCQDHGGKPRLLNTL